MAAIEGILAVISFKVCLMKILTLVLFIHVIG